MPTYLSLINWTEQGIKNFPETTKHAEDFTKLVEASGGKVRELVWTVGKYDIVSVVDFPDEESSVADVAATTFCWEHPYQHRAGFFSSGDGRYHRENELRFVQSDALAGVVLSQASSEQTVRCLFLAFRPTGATRVGRSTRRVCRKKHRRRGPEHHHPAYPAGCSRTAEFGNAFGERLGTATARRLEPAHRVVGRDAFHQGRIRPTGKPFFTSSAAPLFHRRSY